MNYGNEERSRIFNKGNIGKIYANHTVTELKIYSLVSLF